MRLRSAVFALALLWPMLAQAVVTIDPTNAAIHYSPTTWVVTSGSARAVNSGAYMSVVLNTTTTITVNFAGPGYAWSRVDGPYGTWTDQSTSNGAVALTIPASTNGWASHTLELVYTSNNGFINFGLSTTGFNSIVIDTGGTVSAPHVASKQVLAFGDSITAGQHVLNDSSPDAGGDGQDGRFSWGYQMKDWLGVEVGNIGWPSTGFTSTSTYRLADSWNILNNNIPRSIAAIDFILINDGVNDATTNVTADCIAAVNAMLAAGKPTLQIVLIRPFKDSQHTTELQACQSGSSVPARVFFVDTAGFQATAPGTLHPPGWDDIANIGPQVALALMNLGIGLTPTGGWRHF